MRATILAKLREWYILVIAACVILAGLYLASVSSMPDGSAVASVEPSTQTPRPQIVSKGPAPAAAQGPIAQAPEAVRPEAPAWRNK